MQESGHDLVILQRTYELLLVVSLLTNAGIFNKSTFAKNSLGTYWWFCNGCIPEELLFTMSLMTNAVNFQLSNLQKILWARFGGFATDEYLINYFWR